MLLCAFIITACNDRRTEDEPDQLVLENEGPITFSEGNVNLATIRFKRISASGEVKEYYTLDSSMLTSDQLSRLDILGTHSLTITLDDLKLQITVNIISLGDGEKVYITFDAKPGFFQTLGEDNLNPADEYLFVSRSDASLTYFPDPIRDGYDFVGWYTTQDLTGQKIESPYPTSYSHTLYAKWVSSTKINLLFVDNDAGTSVTQTIPEGETYIFENGITQDGKLFTGWRDSSTSEIHLPGTSLVASVDRTFYAVYDVIRFTLSFYADAFVTPENPYGLKEFSVEYGSTFSNYEIPDASITGKTHIWRDRATSLTPVLTNIRSNIAIDAIYTINTYDLLFYMPKLSLAPDFNFENLSFDNPDHYELRQKITVSYDAHITNTPVVTAFDLTDGRQGYSGNWQYRDQGFFSTTEQAESVLNSGIRSNYNFYARYTVMKYTLTYIYGSGILKTTVTINDVPYNTKLTSYDFPDISTDYPQKEWTTVWIRNNLVYDGGVVVVTDNITFEAQHTLNPYIVEFYYPIKTRDGITIDYASLGIHDIIQPVLRTVPNGQNIENIPTFGGNPQYKIVAWTIGGSDVEIAPATLANYSITQFYDKETNAHFTAVVEIIKYTAIFMCLSTVDTDESYTNILTISDIPYNSIINTSTLLGHNLTLLDPSYTNMESDDFTFIGWHAGSDFASSIIINFDDGFTITGDVRFYSEWIDFLKGTPGLIFKAYETDKYEVVGFVPTSSSVDGRPVVFETVVIPEQHEGKPVTKINNSAFADAFTIKIENIMFGSNIIEIDPGAFSGLQYLKSFSILNFSDTGSYVFFVNDDVLFKKVDTAVTLFAFPASKMPNANTYAIPNNLTQGSVTIIETYAFSFNKYITAISDLGNAVTVINEYAFYGAELLTTISFSGLTQIGASAFEDCEYLSNLNGNYASLTIVGENALEGTAWMVQRASYAVLGTVLIRYSDTLTTFYVPDEIRVIAPFAFKTLVGTTMLPLNMIVFGINTNLIIISTDAFTGANVSRVRILKSTKITIDSGAFGSQINTRRTLEVATQMLVDAYKADNTVTNMFDKNNIIISTD
jgi:uncharacterized repeat protein (TIGR02543 family)